RSLEYAWRRLPAALLATAAIALVSGLQFLVIGLRQQREPMYLAYAVLCLCLALLAFSNAMLGIASTVAGATVALRLMCSAAIVSFPSIFVFISTYTGKPVSRMTLSAVAVLSAFFLWLNLTSAHTLLYTSLQQGEPLILPWHESLYTLTGASSVQGDIFHACTYAVFLWGLYRSWIQYKTGEHWSGALLGTCLFIQFAALLWGDIAIDAMGLPYPYADSFAFLPFVLLMAVSLASQLRSRTLQLEQITLKLRAEAETRHEAELNLR
ncbi:MAG: GGDEF-domain containing protein, partial [Rhodanobacter sp.]